MKELKVTPIKNGTVIDHITTGMALKVLKILGIGESIASTVSVVIHVPSAKKSWKDILKVEDRELSPREVDKIALIAPDATINIIRNYSVAEKYRVQVPDVARAILQCANPSCITNSDEPLETEFLVKSKDPLRVRCKYCERELEDIASNLL